MIKKLIKSKGQQCECRKGGWVSLLPSVSEQHNQKYGRGKWAVITGKAIHSLMPAFQKLYVPRLIVRNLLSLETSWGNVLSCPSKGHVCGHICGHSTLNTSVGHVGPDPPVTPCSGNPWLWAHSFSLCPLHCPRRGLPRQRPRKQKQFVEFKSMLQDSDMEKYCFVLLSGRQNEKCFWFWWRLQQYPEDMQNWSGGCSSGLLLCKSSTKFAFLKVYVLFVLWLRKTKGWELGAYLS